MTDQSATNVIPLQPGLAGAVFARAEALVARLALIDALLAQPTRSGPARNFATCSSVTAAPRTSAKRSSGSPRPDASTPSAPSQPHDRRSSWPELGRLSRIALRRSRHVFNILSREK
jgi:hypothetical protein